MSVFSQQDLPVRPVFGQSAVKNRSFGLRSFGLMTILATGAAFGLAGCGSNLRPSVTPVNGTGPAAQPSSYAFVVSLPTPSSDATGTVIDYSGDTIMATADIGPGPSLFTLNSGTEAYTINNDGTISNIPVNTSLQTKNVYFSTLG